MLTIAAACSADTEGAKVAGAAAARSGCAAAFLSAAKRTIKLGPTPKLA